MRPLEGLSPEQPRARPGITLGQAEPRANSDIPLSCRQKGIKADDMDSTTPRQNLGISAYHWLKKDITRGVFRPGEKLLIDRKSTRLNSSHVRISYAVFC